MMKRVTIYTDGACSGNPGPGGWGAVLIFGESRREIGGGEKHTTNNRMELTAAVMALNALKYACEVDLYSDSTYLVDAHLKGWLNAWEQKGFIRGKENKPIPNEDLWRDLLKAERKHVVFWHKVCGHTGVKENEICDKIAVRYAAMMREEAQDSVSDPPSV